MYELRIREGNNSFKQLLCHNYLAIVEVVQIFTQLIFGYTLLLVYKEKIEKLRIA
jgi:hypothetical protein